MSTEHNLILMAYIVAAIAFALGLGWLLGLDWARRWIS